MSGANAKGSSGERQQAQIPPLIRNRQSQSPSRCPSHRLRPTPSSIASPVGTGPADADKARYAKTLVGSDRARRFAASEACAARDGAASRGRTALLAVDPGPTVTAIGDPPWLRPQRRRRRHRSPGRRPVRTVRSSRYRPPARRSPSAAGGRSLCSASGRPPPAADGRSSNAAPASLGPAQPYRSSRGSISRRIVRPAR